MEEQKISECLGELEDVQCQTKKAHKLIGELRQENADLIKENESFRNSIKILLACSLTSGEQEGLLKKLLRDYPMEDLPKFLYKMVVELGIQPSDILWTLKEQSA